MVGLAARGRAHREGNLALTHQGGHGAGNVHVNPVGRKSGRQPAPAFKISGDLGDAAFDRHIERRHRAAAQFAVVRQAMPALEGLEGLDQTWIEDVVPRRHDGRIFQRQPFAQSGHAAVFHARHELRACRNLLPAAGAGDRPVVRQRLHQGLVSGVLRRQGRQPLSDCVLGQGRFQARTGIVRCRAQVPFLVEIGNGHSA